MKQVLTKHGVKAVMLFIAELNGFKSGTVKAKVHYGVNCWLTSKLHELDYTDYTSTIKANSVITDAERTKQLEEEAKRLEDVNAETHENMWLERLYNGLDNHFNISSIIKTKAITDRDALIYIMNKHVKSTYLWDIPIELDASASMIQWMGVLMGDHRLTDMTNVTGITLSDPWAFEGIPRTQFKHAATPMLYGSSKACHELWQDRKHQYTLQQVELFNKEITSGALGIANMLKEFLINNCKPTERMKVNINDEIFEIECNRYRHIGDTTTKYDIYDSITKRIRTIVHTTTKSVADLDQFRRYFVTLLVHNLDSQVANKVIGKVMTKYGWGIDIHDAFIVHPNAALDVRRWYAAELTHVYNNRSAILTNYFNSIGIGNEAQAEWNRLISMVHPITGTFKANLMALK